VLAQVIEGLPAVEDGQPAGGLELEKVNRGADELELGAELLSRQGLDVDRLELLQQRVAEFVR
jgi:hypothetical protein